VLAVEPVEMESTVGKVLAPRKGLTPERGAAIVLWLGLGLMVMSVVSGLLAAFRNGPISYFSSDTDSNLLDRFQVFVQASITPLAWSAVVLAIGIGLHIWVRRPVAAPAPAVEALPELDAAPVQLPPPPTGVVRIQPTPADDDFWRR
jgi:hypothetical protein